VLVDGVRVRLYLAGTGTVLAEQVVAVRFVFVAPVPGSEVCRTYDPGSIEWLTYNAPTDESRVLSVKLPDGQVMLVQSFTGATNRGLAEAVVRANDTICDIGSDFVVDGGPWELTYFKGPRPMPAIGGESCRAYDPMALRVVDRGQGIGWQLLDGAGLTASAGRTAEDADRALAVARRSTRLCVVPMTDPALGPLEYWR
jgi:hypothetical protein